VPASFFVNSERLDEEHEAWHDVVERVLMSSARLRPVLEMRLAGEEIRLEVTTPDERLRALMTLHGALMPMPAEERAQALERLVAWSGLELMPREDHRVMLGAEVRALSRLPGCSIGSHSARHLLLPGHPADVQRAELRDCKQTLEALIGQPVPSFCYPFGEHSAALAETVRQTPYLLAVTVDRGLVTGSTDPMLLPRYEIANCTVEEYAAIIGQAFAAGDTWKGGRGSIPGLPEA
jgi:peptidoglycan/xylan/chitin deacetylase (PgdA/CDA1 family)